MNICLIEAQGKQIKWIQFVCKSSTQVRSLLSETEQLGLMLEQLEWNEIQTDGVVFE